MAPARVQKRLYYKIGEACKALDIQPYVLRYWETEFPPLSPTKSRSGQRVYSEKELAIIRRIKELLYEEGYTIAGAKKKLEAELAGGTLSAGDEDGEGEAGAAKAPAAKEAARPAVSPAASRAARPAAAGDGAPASVALDTRAAERIQSMRTGILEALSEAREILALLDAKSPPRV